MTSSAFSDRDYQDLLAFRVSLRRFLRWSQEQAAAAGLTPQQHQLLLAIRGHPGTSPPTIGDIAEHLLVKHHSAVELIDRAVRAGLVERSLDEHDRRLARLSLTAHGRAVLRRLTEAHLDELHQLGPVVAQLTDRLQPTGAPGQR